MKPAANKSNKSKEDGGTFKKIQLFAAVSLLMVSVLLFFNNPGITGHVTADFRSQILNMEIDKSQSFLLNTNADEPMYINSIRITGEVIGDGSVEVYIDNNQGQNVLVYKNVKKKSKGLTAVTGMAVAPQGDEIEAQEAEQKLILLESLGTFGWSGGLSLDDGEEFFEGSFKNKCFDTCFIEMPLSKTNSYEMIFNIEPGTKLMLNKITYTMKDEGVGE
ncbi:hypothetical protein GF336_02505 [Candidatus Woesearchaeota archaeon]|nr:hypothetical protein [Candidatus Woesearchaeota archaeon]